MKNRYVLFLFMLTGLFAQFDWQDNGVPIRQGAHIEWFKTVDVGDNGTMIFAWTDTRQGLRDIYAQKVDVQGNKLWGENGITVVDTDGRQEDPILITDGNGGAYITWRDFNDDPDPNGDIYAQHILSDGSLGWQQDRGLPLATAAGKHDGLNMCSDGQNGAYVIWRDYSENSYGSVYGTHLSENGSSSPDGGTPILTDESYHTGVSIEKAGSGHAVLVWADVSIADDNNIRAQRINQSIETLWSAPDQGGIMVSSALFDQSYPKVTYYDENYSIIVWEDHRNSISEDQSDIYYQFLDVNGSSLLEQNGVPVCIDEGTQIKPRAKASSQGAFIVWEDYRNDNVGNDIDVYSQKVDHLGNIYWDNNGIPIVSEVGDQNNERLTVDNAGGVYYVWMDKRNNDNTGVDIYLQHVNSDGTISFEENGLVISNEDGTQKGPIVRLSSQGVFVIWGETCGNYTCDGLYIQHVTTEDGITLESQGKDVFSGINGNCEFQKSIYLGNNENLIYWQDRRFSPLQNLTYGMKFSDINSLSENQDGVSLSNNAYQSNATIVSAGSNLFMGFDQTDGDINQFYDILDYNLSSILGQSVGVDANNLYSQPYYSMVFNELENLIYYIYSDNRDGAYNIYVQQFDISGNPTWTSSIKIAETIGSGVFQSDDNVIGALPNDNGGCIVLYNSGYFLEKNIYAIAIDSNGQIQEGWDSEGLKLSNNNDDQYIESFVHTPYGILVTFKDDRSGSNDIYAQLISYSGELLFDAEGLNIVDAENDQESSSVSYSEIADEALICWDDYRTGEGYDLYCKYINFVITESDLSYALSDEIELSGQSNTSGGNQQSSFIYPSQSGSFLITWEDYRNDIDGDVYFQEISGYNFRLTNGGEKVCDMEWPQLSPKIDLYSESDGSYVIYWQDLRSTGKEYLFNIYAQSYTTDWIDLDNDLVQIPNQFGIQKTYPNPFNPSLSIDFTIQEISNIELSIYNLYGQQVDVLYQGSMGVGSHSIKWSPESQISSGMYFVRLKNKSTNLIDSKKIVFIK